MSGVDQKKRLRLTPLVVTSGTPRSLEDSDRLLELAIVGKVQLYAEVPPGKVAYVDPSRPVASIFRTSYMGSTVTTPLKLGDSGSQSWIRPEVTFVGLHPLHAEKLRVSRHIKVDRFPSGLAHHPSEVLRKKGWMVLREFSSALGFCSTAQAADDPEFMVVRLLKADEGPKLIKLPPREPVRPIQLQDVYVDERAITILESMGPSRRNDPHDLHDRAPNVYHLYRAAFSYSRHLKEGIVSASRVKSELRSKEPKLFIKSTAVQAVKLIDPNYSRGLGKSKNLQKEFDRRLLAKPSFKARYRQDSFVNDALALILYSNDWWLTKKSQFENGASNREPNRDDLDEKLSKLGFYDGDEVTAVRRMVMWPAQ